MAIIRQASFASGELAPQLWGRTDSPLRARGLKACRNFFVSKHGALISRPGLRYCGEAKNVSDTWRLLPFIYSDSQSYVIEMGHQYLRIWSNGAQVNPIDGVSNELATTYTNAQLPNLKYVQSGDVLFLVHPAHPPRKLTRTAHNMWVLDAVVFDRPAPTDVVHTVPPYGTPSVGCHKLQNALPAEDVVNSMPALEWRWMVTEILRDARGFEYESAPFLITQSCNADGTNVLSLPERIPVYKSKPVYVQFFIASGLSSTDSLRKRWRVYRGRGGLFGWVGDSQSAEWRDDGHEPDYSRQPPQGTNPFKVRDFSTNPPSTTRTENPAVVGFFEERLGFANTSQRPGYLFFSATGDYYNFDRSLLPFADHAGEWDLMARRREEIRNWIPLAGKLILLTNSSVWSFGGKGGAALSPAPGDIPEARPHIDIGSSWLDALRVGDSVIYARAKGTGVRDLLFDLERASYSGGDISFIAQHLFDNRTLVDWCYQEDPWGVVWAVRDDGRMLSLSYDRQSGLLAWALHKTGDEADGSYDAVKAVCCVPETNVDTVYAVVTRNLNGSTRPFIERLASRTLPYKQDQQTPDTKETIAFDSCRTTRNPGTFTIGGLADFNGKAVLALVDGAVFGPFTVAGGQLDLTAPDAGGSGMDPISNPAAITVVHVGLSYECEVKPLELAHDGNKEKLVKRVLVEVDASRGLWVGPDAAHLREWRQRTVADSYSVLSAATGVVDMAVESGWDTRGDVLLRQKDPLFVSIYAVSRDVEMGGR